MARSRPTSTVVAMSTRAPASPPRCAAGASVFGDHSARLKEHVLELARLPDGKDHDVQVVLATLAQRGLDADRDPLHGHLFFETVWIAGERVSAESGG